MSRSSRLHAGPPFEGKAHHPQAGIGWGLLILQVPWNRSQRDETQRKRAINIESWARKAKVSTRQELCLLIEPQGAIAVKKKASEKGNAGKASRRSGEVVFDPGGNALVWARDSQKTREAANQGPGSGKNQKKEGD